jgi:hypothetical protein
LKTGDVEGSLSLLGIERGLMMAGLGYRLLVELGEVAVLECSVGKWLVKKYCYGAAWVFLATFLEG